MNFLLGLLLNAAVFMGVAHLMPGFRVETFLVALFAAAMFGVVNALLRPILLLVTLPATILTLGLFTLVIDGVVMGLTAWLIPGFSIDTFGTAVIGWILVSLGGFVVQMVLKK